jgi:YHS domain-containing protein
MSDVTALLSRIDAEFATVEKSIKAFQEDQVQAHQAKEQRIAQYQQVCDQLKKVWAPRLQALAEKFGEKVQVKPAITPLQRAAKFSFNSPLAAIDLTFAVSADFEVRNVLLDYNLHVLPILMKFEPHRRMEFPVDKVDTAAIGNWLDDRIVEFVQTYLALHQNQYYLQGKTVTDPVSGTQFPKYAAADSLQHDGQTYHFIGAETRREFQKQKGLPVT